MNSGAGNDRYIEFASHTKDIESADYVSGEIEIRRLDTDRHGGLGGGVNDEITAPACFEQCLIVSNIGLDHLYSLAFQQVPVVISGLVDLVGRSEEHTSELQSRENLVCRLLLEKKKQ